MNKLKRIMAAMAAAVTMVVSCVSVGAEDSKANEESKNYTLEQLFDMSDEEFLKLEGAESLYNAKLSSEPFNNISGMVYYWIGDSVDDGSYKRGKTEKELSALLGDTVKYKFIDPIDNVPEDYKTDDKSKITYRSVFEVKFTDYSRSENDTTPFDNMKFAKCRYCVDQVIPTKYVMSGVPMGIMYTTSTKGDMDGNNMVDLADATSIAKYNVGIYPLNSAQILVGDMNGDGVIDSLDLSTIIEKQLGK